MAKKERRFVSVEDDDDLALNHPLTETVLEKEKEINLNKQKDNKTKEKKKPSIIVYLLSVLIFAGMVFHGVKDYILVSSYTFLPSQYVQYFLYGLIGFGVVFGLFALLPLRNLGKILTSILCVVLAFALAEVSIILPTYKGRLERAFVEVPSEGEMNINVYTLKDSGIKEIKDLAGKKVAIQSQLDLEYQEYALIVINRELEGQETIKQEYEDIYSTVEALYNKEVDAILLNQSYVEILSDNDDFSDFTDVSNVVYTCTQKITLDYDDTAVGDITTEPFIMMIGANDTWDYTSIRRVTMSSGCGRTDVNLMVAINPTTKQALIVTIPRDSYIYLWNNKNCPDKLTHATVYDLECWLETLNAFMGVEINYYMRVNFSSVVNIVDSLGGLDINNPYEFEGTVHNYDLATGIDKTNPYIFEEGLIHLNGAQTLSYVRERHHLPNSDLDRNKHQAIALKALVDRVTTVEGITHFGDLLEAVEGTFATNITVDQIYALAQMQLNDMASWNIQQISVTGTPASRPCYVMGLGSGSFSVVLIDQNSVTTAKSYIEKVFDGEIITIN